MATQYSLHACSELNAEAFINKQNIICDPPQDFNAQGEITLMKRFHLKTKEFILTRFSTLETIKREEVEQKSVEKLLNNSLRAK